MSTRNQDANGVHWAPEAQRDVSDSASGVGSVDGTTDTSDHTAVKRFPSQSASFVRNPITLQYLDPAVERSFMLHSQFRGRMLTSFMMVAAASITFLVVFLDGLIDFWFGKVNLAVFGLMLILGLAHGVFVKAYDTKRIQNAIFAIQVHEVVAVLFLLMMSVLPLEYYAFQASCYELYKEEMSGLASLYHRCSKPLDTYSVLVQLFPIFFVQVRFLTALPVCVLALLNVPIGRSLAPDTPVMDTMQEFGLKMTIHTAITVLLAYLLWIRSAKKRKGFENWVDLQNATVESAEQRLAVDDLLYGLLPSWTADRLHRGEAAFDVSEQATVCVATVHQFARWSTTLTTFEMVTVMEAIVQHFDEWISKDPAVIKLKTTGDIYIASSRLEQATTGPTPADAAAGVAQFAQGIGFLTSVVSPLAPQMKVGVFTGMCCGGVIGSKALWYEVAGDALIHATELANAADPTTVLASRTTIHLLDGAVKTKGEELTIESAISGAIHASVLAAPIVVPRPGRRKRRKTRAVPTTNMLEEQVASLLQNPSSPRNSNSGKSPAVDTPLSAADSSAPSELQRSPDISEGMVTNSSMVSCGVENLSLQEMRYVVISKRLNAEGLDEEPDAPIRADNVNATKKQLQIDLNGCKLRFKFTEPMLEDWYQSYDDGLAGPRYVALPFALGTIALMYIVGAIENSLTIVSAMLLFATLLTIVAWLVIVHVQKLITLPDPILAFLWYAIPILATGWMPNSTFSTRRINHAFVVVAFSTQHLSRCNWIINTVVSSSLVLLCLVMDFMHTTGDTTAKESFGLVLIVAMVGYSVEQARRKQFSEEALSKILHDVSAAELSRHRKMLNLVVPPVLADAFSTRLLEKNEISGATILESLQDTTVCSLRLDTFTSRLQELLDEPAAALEEVERMYGWIEEVVAKHSIIEKVQTVGDEVMLAGPLRRQKRIRLTDASRAHGADHKKVQPYGNSTAEDEALFAALEMLRIISKLKAGVGQLTAAVDVDSAFATIVGRDRPTFSLRGPCTRMTQAVLNAAPKGSILFTKAFHRMVFENWRQQVPWTLGTGGLWRLQGAGSVQVFYAQPTADGTM